MLIAYASVSGKNQDMSPNYPGYTHMEIRQ